MIQRMNARDRGQVALVFIIDQSLGNVCHKRALRPGTRAPILTAIT